MIRIDDGGPAFPQQDAVVNNINRADGMSLRDWFAGQALIGLLSMEANPRIGTEVEPFAKGKHESGVASCAYALADAMLAERAKDQP